VHLLWSCSVTIALQKINNNTLVFFYSLIHYKQQSLHLATVSK